jgi:Transmembrane amino acid transporter protein
MLGISISFNAMSSHGACTAIFVMVAAIIGFALGSIQTLHEVSWLAWVGATSILTASKSRSEISRCIRSDNQSIVLTLTIAVGVQNKPAAAPPGPFQSDWKGLGHPPFESAISACSSIVFAWAGTPAFFSIASEMRAPEQYTRSLLLCQSVVGVTYIVIGVVVYYYCGSFVASPALGSAGTLLKKVCYGLALPGLCVSTLLFVHVSTNLWTISKMANDSQIAAKYIFVRMLRGSYHLTDPTFRHWATWLGCTFGVTLISYIIASAIPVFGGLVSLIGALLGTLMCFQPMGAMWLYDNWHNARTGKWYAMVAWSGFVIVSGFFLMIGGTYGSVVDIKNAYAESGGSSPWSCADNSNSS